MATNEREQRGKEIAQHPDQIKRIDENTYEVKSQSNDHEYKVFKVSDEWFCECPDHVYRHSKCKHIFAVEFSASLRAEVKIRSLDTEVNVQTCQYCGSPKIVKDGKRHNKNGDLQIYTCQTCGHYFTINLGFERMRATPQIITSSMQLYFTGESLRNIQKFLRLQGVKVSHVAILKWIRKYVKLMNAYLEKIQPQVSDTWRADELFVKIKGDLKYLFAIMDDETRFWIAQEVADTKDRHDARTLFSRAKYLMGKQPKTLVTDGLPSYFRASSEIFPEIRHIKNITFKGERNNNKMERMNGEVRDREKVMRGLKTKETPILSGYQLFHNYIRPHEGLDDKTPAEACGITIEGKNKWITLIQNASKQNSKTNS